MSVEEDNNNNNKEILPLEVVVQVLDFLRTPRDVAHCASVCRLWNRAAADLTVWKNMCVDKFGPHVANDTTVNHEYYNHGDWKLFLKDDGKRAGALPTIQWKTRSYDDTKETHGIACHWRYNGQRTRLFYCCWIECLKWDRLAGTVRLYLDARGEEDLRHPESSDFLLSPDNNPLRGQWVSELDDDDDDGEETRRRRGGRDGHFKGYLELPADDFLVQEPNQRLVWVFRFACNFLGTQMTDYPPKSLLHLPATRETDRCPFFHKQQGDLTRARTLYTLNVSPFAQDTPAIERERWLNIFPKEVLDRGRHDADDDEQPGFRARFLLPPFEPIWWT